MYLNGCTCSQFVSIQSLLPLKPSDKGIMLAKAAEFWYFQWQLITNKVM